MSFYNIRDVCVDEILKHKKYVNMNVKEKRKKKDIYLAFSLNSLYVEYLQISRKQKSFSSSKSLNDTRLQKGRKKSRNEEKTCA